MSACGRLAFALAWLVGASFTGAAFGQDFAATGAPWPDASPFSCLERGFPSARSGFEAGACVGRPFGLAELDTRAAALAISFRSLRAAAGISQTGEDPIGWRAAGAAIGFARAPFGAAVRVVARLDDDAPLSGWRQGGLGVEMGGGGWATIRPGFLAWASAPAVWSGGAAPPLARGLAIGVRAGSGALAASLAHEADARHGGSLAVGISTRIGDVEIELRGRERPMRAALRLSAAVRRLVLSVDAENHPVLPETVRLAIGIAGRDAMSAVSDGSGAAP